MHACMHVCRHVHAYTVNLFAWWCMPVVCEELRATYSLAPTTISPPPPPNTPFTDALQSLGWRTMLVVPELENELAVNQASHATQYELRMLRQARADVDSQLQRLEWAVARGEVSGEQAAQVQAQLGLLAAEREAVKERYSRLLR